jgi:hypothetical protein
MADVKLMYALELGHDHRGRVRVMTYDPSLMRRKNVFDDLLFLCLAIWRERLETVTIYGDGPLKEFVERVDRILYDLGLDVE